jgi:cytochrome c oxidase subunit 1
MSEYTKENVITSAWSRNIPARFKICPVMGKKIHKDAENLIRINLIAAFTVFAIGALCAMLLVLTRWQAVHLLPVDWYYRILTAHGVNMLIFFMIFFEMALFYFSGPVMLDCRLPTPLLGWAGFALMCCGVVLVEYTIFTGQADVLFTSYVPLKAHLLYYMGIALFAVGALLVTGLFFAVLVIARRERTYKGSVPLFTFAGLTAAIITVMTISHGAAIYIPTLLWAAGQFELDAEIYRIIFWGLGHCSQQINVAFQVGIWYLLGGLTCGAVVLNEKVSRIAFFLYILFISMGSAHHLLVDPGLGPAWKIWNTSYAMYLAVLASLIHGFTVPGGLEYGMRLRGFVRGKFEWLQKAPWGDPGFSGMFLSLVIFGFLGGITGVTLGAEQINIIAHNTLRITGHFHVTVVGGAALSFMAMGWYTIPLCFSKKISFWRLARIQPYVFAIGICTMGMSMIALGALGIPRRHWDVSFANALFDVQFPPMSSILFALMGIGGVTAAIAGLMFSTCTLGSIFFGTELLPSDYNSRVKTPGVLYGISHFPRQSFTDAEVEKIHQSGGAQGTVVLVCLLLACFILFYFTNWQLLSSVLWRVG